MGLLMDWQNYNDNLPQSTVTAIVRHKGKFYAGTTFDGVWKLDQQNLSTENQLTTVPNLVSEMPIQFSYHLKEAETVQLKISNQFGQHIATLVNTFQTAGSYQVDYTTSTLQAGTYFATLYIGNKQTKSKFIIIK